MKKLLLFAAFLAVSSLHAQLWTEYPTSQPAVSTGMRSISIIDSNNAWLSPSCGTTGCTAIRRWAKTTNGGTVWTTGVVDLGATSADLEIANIHGIDASNAYAAVFPKASSPGGIWKTANGGTSWTKQTTATFSDAASFTNLVYFWDANTGVCMGDPANGYFEIYTTTNGGTNWTRVASTPALVPVDPQDYGLTNQFTVNGNNIWIGTTFGRILRSTDKGLTWSAFQSPIPDFGGGINGSGAGDMAFTDANNGLLQTDAYQLFSTADGGANWTEIVLDPETAVKNFGISEIPGLPNVYISVGEDLLTSPARGSAWTVDGGITWYNCDDIDQVDGGVVAFLNSNTGFASGFSTSAAVGGIWKWNGVDLLATNSFSKDKMFSAFISPSTRMLEVNGKNIANVTLFDVLGKQVFNSKYDSVNNASINVDGLNSGVYLVKVTNNTGANATIKVIKN